MNELIHQDELYAQQRRYKFQVCKKESKGKPWITCSDNLESLSEAIRLVNDITSYEVAIFIIKNDFGFMYWSSNSNTYNHTVIYQT
ncbi:hypothetical protein L3D26_02915 [Moraxella sp. ZY21109]|uniref:hypothetical protein n=1 Tax=Moraxella sp. ZY21109 TaxID=2911969 RepID=UPI003D7C4AE5